MNELMKNNQCVIEGVIDSPFTNECERFGEKFYLTIIKVKRVSGQYDTIKVMISERDVLDTTKDLTGTRIRVEGQYRSRNHDGHLLLYIAPRKITIVDDKDAVDCNKIILNGTICKQPNYRTTPLKREITDFLLAVNRNYGRSDYIPCICWYRTARFISSLNIGDKVKICGRIQSRNYTKLLEDGNVEDRVTYEVSANIVETIKETNNEAE